MDEVVTGTAIEVVAQYEDVLQNILNVQVTIGWLLAIIVGLLLALIVMRFFK